MAKIIDTAVPSYAAKVVIDLYRNRKEIVESYKATAKDVTDFFEDTKDSAKKFIKEIAGSFPKSSILAFSFPALLGHLDDRKKIFVFGDEAVEIKFDGLKVEIKKSRDIARLVNLNDILTLEKAAWYTEIADPAEKALVLEAILEAKNSPGEKTVLRDGSAAVEYIAGSENSYVITDLENGKKISFGHEHIEPTALEVYKAYDAMGINRMTLRYKLEAAHDKHPEYEQKKVWGDGWVDIPTGEKVPYESKNIIKDSFGLTLYSMIVFPDNYSKSSEFVEGLMEKLIWAAPNPEISAAEKAISTVEKVTPSELANNPDWMDYERTGKYPSTTPKERPSFLSCVRTYGKNSPDRESIEVWKKLKIANPALSAPVAKAVKEGKVSITEAKAKAPVKKVK